MSFKARRLERPVDQQALFALAGKAPLFYWHSPRSAFTVLGIGVAAEVRCGGNKRFRDAASSLKTMFSAVDAGCAEKDQPRPVAIGGFAFGCQDPPGRVWREFPSLLICLPRRQWLTRNGVTWAIEVEGGDKRHGSSIATRRWLASPAQPGSEPRDKIRWERRVRETLMSMDQGRIEKVVLGRTLTMPRPPATGVGDILSKAGVERPMCFNFAVRMGTTSFIGSSPELLAAVCGSAVECNALAGSAPRSSDGKLDARRAEELGRCPKNLLEHGIVRSALIRSLGSMADDLEVEADPKLISVPEAHHLRTRLRGTLKDKLSVIDVVARLHPTPAVCGTPREEARRIIEEAEDRGWWSGAVGWVDGNGDGEFSVALRSALLESDRAHLWAGAGIVRGSRPEEEFFETETKMSAMRNLLCEETRLDVG